MASRSSKFSLRDAVWALLIATIFVLFLAAVAKAGPEPTPTPLPFWTLTQQELVHCTPTPTPTTTTPTTAANAAASKLIFYGNTVGSLGNWTALRCDPCDAHVGIHTYGPLRGQPLGNLANKELRSWRMAAHEAFDALWKTGGFTRGACYRWLASTLNLTEDRAHIALFDVAQCRALIKAVNERRSLAEA